MGFFSGISDAVAGAIGGVASTILGNNSAKHEAEKNRDWQENMSNTSIQRRVEDLKAAGLNPLLAVSSASAGASTPTGAQAQIQRFNPADISALANARLVSAQAEAQENDNKLHDTKAEGLRLQNKLLQQGILSSEVERKLTEARTFGEIERALTEGYRRANINASTEKIRNEATLLGITKEYYQSGANNEDFLLKYPGFAEKMTAENFRTPYSAIGTFGSGLASATARGVDKFSKWWNGVVNRANKMRW